MVANPDTIVECISDRVMYWMNGPTRSADSPCPTNGDAHATTDSAPEVSINLTNNHANLATMYCMPPKWYTIAMKAQKKTIAGRTEAAKLFVFTDAPKMNLRPTRARARKSPMNLEMYPNMSWPGFVFRTTIAMTNWIKRPDATVYHGIAFLSFEKMTMDVRRTTIPAIDWSLEPRDEFPAFVSGRMCTWEADRAYQ